MSDLIGAWLVRASVEQLKAKAAEYEDRDGVLSPRDQENRTLLRRRIKQELEEREHAR